MPYFPYFIFSYVINPCHSGIFSFCHTRTCHMFLPSIHHQTQSLTHVAFSHQLLSMPKLCIHCVYHDFTVHLCKSNFKYIDHHTDGMLMVTVRAIATRCFISICDHQIMIKNRVKFHRRVANQIKSLVAPYCVYPIFWRSCLYIQCYTPIDICKVVSY